MKLSNKLKGVLSAGVGTAVGVSVYAQISSSLIATVAGVKALPYAISAGVIYTTATYGTMAMAEDVSEWVSEKLAEREINKLRQKSSINTHADASC